jgi:hypothetical protein
MSSLKNYRITKTGVVHLTEWVRGSGTNDHIIGTLCGRTDAAAPFLSTIDDATCKSCLKIAPHGTDLTVTPMGTKLGTRDRIATLNESWTEVNGDADTVANAIIRAEAAEPKASAEGAGVTAVACGECGIMPHDLACGTGVAEEQERTGIHAACGVRIADHCAYCDTCPRGSEQCGCLAEDRVLPIHVDCGKPMADHCANCDECPRTGGPCWCVATAADDEPVIIVPASRGPRYEIDFDTARPWDDDPIGGLEAVIGALAEQRREERAARVLTVADVVSFSPVADILATLATVPDAPRWTARHGKIKRNRRNRKG